MSPRFVQRYISEFDEWFEFDRAMGEFTNPNVQGPEHKTIGPEIIRDIDPYTTAAVDKTTGKTAQIGGRRQHREFLQRNGYREVGNDWTNPVHTGPDKKDVIQDLNRAIATGMTPEVRAYVERNRR
jgi:hypothetical protein